MSESKSNSKAKVHPDAEANARKLILRCGYASAAVALIPIPFSATIGVAPIHVGMVLGLGNLYEVEVGKDSAVALITRIAATAGASYIVGRLAIGLGKMVVPFLPGLVGAPIIFANTLAIGAVARAYFLGREDLDDDEIRELYREALGRARKEFNPKEASSDEAMEAAREAVESAQSIEIERQEIEDADEGEDEVELE